MSDKRTYQIVTGLVIMPTGAFLTYFQYSAISKALKKEKDKNTFVTLLIFKKMILTGTGLSWIFIFILGIFLVIKTLLN